MAETILETPRLWLRPFRDSDAADVYAYAKDPRVGPIAGWQPHKSPEESRQILRTVFSAPRRLRHGAEGDGDGGRLCGVCGESSRRDFSGLP